MQNLVSQKAGQTDFFHMSQQSWKIKQKNYKIQHMLLKLEKTGNKVSLLPTTLSYFLEQHSYSLAQSSQEVNTGKTKYFSVQSTQMEG